MTPGEQWAIGIFPELATDSAFGERSPSTPAYNCIAFAAGDVLQWWWPFPEKHSGRRMYWPLWAPRQETVAAFVRAFEGLGYRRCRNGKLRRRFEKVAIYAANAGVPTHAALQTPQGIWKSKLGTGIDIEHARVNALVADYGPVVVYMRRRKDGLIYRLGTLIQFARRRRP